ncbi:MAG: hypothetical protein O6922_02540 [Chloroflexi bacterium]|nr:hypothetical protein [Chloroflexota bacterium]
MGRRIIRRRRPATSRRMVVRRSVTADASGTAPLRKGSEQKKSTILVATSNSVRNQILSKLATFDEVTLVGMAKSPDDALKILIQEHPDAVILDTDFGGDLVGLDTAKLMQKTRAHAAIIMLVPEIDPEVHHAVARRFGTSWSFMKRTTAARENVLSIALKSSIRGVQWIEPELSRPLAELWKVAGQARDLEARQLTVEPVAISTSLGRKSMKNSVNQADPAESTPKPVPTEASNEAKSVEPEGEQPDDKFEDELAPGVELNSTLDPEVEGFDVTSVSVGKGGIGRGVGRVRRTK